MSVTPATRTKSTTTKEAPPAAAKKEEPGLILHKAGGIARERIKLKALVYGQSGVGKTHFASGAKNVAVCLVEAQGFATIRDAHPEAIVLGKPNAAGVPVLTSMDEVREFLLMAKRGVLAEAGIETLVFDSITEIQQMLMAEIQGSKTKNRDVFSKQDYGTMGTKMRALLRMIRDLPYNIIVLGLADWFIDEESGRRIMSPLVKGSISKEIAGYFNVVGFAYKRQDDNAEGGVEHYILTDGDDKYITKPFGGLKGVLVPDFDLWLEVAADEDGEPRATAAGAPLPSTSTSGERRKRPRFGEDPDEADDEADE